MRTRTPRRWTQKTDARKGRRMNGGVATELSTRGNLVGMKISRAQGANAQIMRARGSLFPNTQLFRNYLCLLKLRAPTDQNGENKQRKPCCC